MILTQKNKVTIFCIALRVLPKILNRDNVFWQNFIPKIFPTSFAKFLEVFEWECLLLLVQRLEGSCVVIMLIDQLNFDFPNKVE